MVLTKTQINAIKNDFYKRVADKDPDSVNGSIHHEARLVWETIVNSSDEHSPTGKEMFPKWIDQAHDLTDDWFFKIIEGELERRFE